jgi:hypothetical protein
MSLRAFHLLFIALSVVLAAFFAAWASNQYLVAGGIGYVLTALVSLTAGGALAVYGVMFQRKTRSM